jgi:hypothetical protein
MIFVTQAPGIYPMLTICGHLPSNTRDCQRAAALPR